MQTWTPAEFVLYGKLCDDGTLSQQLEKIRQALQADTTILLVSRGSQFFRSMIYVADRDQTRARKLRAALIHDCNESLQEESRELPPSRYGGSLAEAVHVFPQPAFHSCLMKHFVGALYVAAIPEHPHIHTALLPTDEAPPSLMVVALSPTAIEGDVLGKFIEQRQALVCMVNASQAVRAHRWNYSMREVDRLLDECEKKWEVELEKTAHGTTEQPGNDFDRVLSYSAKLLLGLAAKLTRSSIGQVFLAQSNALRLRVLASKKHTCEIEKMVGIVALAYHRVRAVLINDIQAFEDTHPGVKYIPPKGAARASRAELAVPITQNTAGDDQGVIGVLNVEKEASDPGYYTTRDLDVCQHLARRFCRWRARIQHTIFARSLAQLTRKVALRSGSVTQKPSTSQGSNGRGLRKSYRGMRGHMHMVDGKWYDDRIPSEFRQALKPVEEALKTAFELTRSHMVRVFLVTADASALVPFCDWPVKDVHQTEPKMPVRFVSQFDGGPKYDEALDAAGRRICLPVIELERHARSISAWVARHGRPCFIGNFADPDALKEYKGLSSYLRTYDGTRSECCIPLFITGRLIGTLNFQSYYVDAYREQRHLIDSIAELIGLTFAHERRAVEQEILESRAVFAYHRHELIHEVDELRILAGQQRSPEKFLNKIKHVTNMLGLESIPIAPRKGRRSVAGLVRQQHERVLTKEIFDFDPRFDAAFAGDSISKDTITPFMVAVEEVLRTSQLEALLAEGRVTIACEKRWLGGHAYAVIQVKNPCSSKGPVGYQHELYRQPYRAKPNGRLHLGAFIAGSLLRAVGGEMSFEMSRNSSAEGFTARTLIEAKLQPRRRT